MESGALGNDGRRLRCGSQKRMEMSARGWERLNEEMLERLRLCIAFETNAADDCFLKKVLR